MKITNNTAELLFTPYSITILVETEQEHEALLAMTLRNVSIPDIVAGKNNPQHEQAIHDFLNGLRKEVQKMQK